MRPVELSPHGEAVRALLNQGYAAGHGQVAEPSTWIDAVTQDPEFEPAFCISAVEPTSGRIVGFVQAWNTGFVKELAVDEGYRRNGIGHALVSKLADHARAKGLQQLSLKVVLSNRGAFRFYTRLGFS